MARLKICCIKLSLATRIIAMVGLITSVLVLTQLASELTERGGSSDGGTVSILLGLDIDEFQSMSGRKKDDEDNAIGLEIMVAFLLFALVYAISSAILVWGSIVEAAWCAFPWLLCEAVSFISQIVTVCLHGFTIRSTKDKWIILLSLFNICLSVYFWVVVFLAQRAWSRQAREHKENETESTASTSSRTLGEDVLAVAGPGKPLHV